MGKSPTDPPGKNPSDAHACRCICPDNLIGDFWHIYVPCSGVHCHNGGVYAYRYVFSCYFNFIAFYPFQPLITRSFFGVASLAKRPCLPGLPNDQGAVLRVYCALLEAPVISYLLSTVAWFSAFAKFSSAVCLHSTLFHGFLPVRGIAPIYTGKFFSWQYAVCTRNQARGPG